MLGDPDDLYIAARCALLDAAEALGPHLDSIVLVGAQAIYLHTGDGELNVQAFTTDADFSVRPADLDDSPLIASLLIAAGFTTREHPGGWVSPGGVYVDLMVPEALAGRGRRGADLGPHGRHAARRAKGLEGAAIDCVVHTIRALDTRDHREVTMKVAGAAALLVAKLHKIFERSETIDRLKDKDALDVVRILQAVPTSDLSNTLFTLSDSPEAGTVTVEAIELLGVLFGVATGVGVQMAVRASAQLIDPDELSLATLALASRLTDAMADRRANEDQAGSERNHIANSVRMGRNIDQ